MTATAAEIDRPRRDEIETPPADIQASPFARRLRARIGRLRSPRP